VFISLDFWTSPGSVDIDDRKRVWSSVWVEDHGRLVSVLPQVQLQTVAVLGGVVAIGASVLVDGCVRLHVRVQHRLVDARVAAVIALERLRAEVVSQMILEMMLVFGDEGTFRAGQQFFWFDVTLAVLPEILFRDCDKLALLAFESFDFSLRVDPWYSNALLVFQLLGGQAVLVLEVDPVVVFILGHVVALLAAKLVVVVDVVVELIPGHARVSAEVAVKSGSRVIQRRVQVTVRPVAVMDHRRHRLVANLSKPFQGVERGVGARASVEVVTAVRVAAVFVIVGTRLVVGTARRLAKVVAGIVERRRNVAVDRRRGRVSDDADSALVVDHAGMMVE
jgi:hypothetical protein